jgi:competence protein ComEA
MEHGRIVERGTHDELVEHRGVYRQLHDAQSRARSRSRAAGGNGGATATRTLDPPRSPPREEARSPATNGGGKDGAPGTEDHWADPAPSSGETYLGQFVSPKLAGKASVSWRQATVGNASGEQRTKASRQPPPPPAINVNEASVDELMRLPGVGRRAAARIVAERERNGPFESVADLTRVKRFDDARVRRLSAQAKV